MRNIAKNNSGLSKKQFIFGLLFASLFGAWIVGLADYGLGILIDPTLYRSGELKDAFFTILFVLGIFGVLGLLFFFFISCLALIKLISKDKTPSLLLGFYLGLSFFFLLPCLFYFPNEWMTGLGLGMLLFGSLLIGLAIYWGLEKIGTDFKEKSYFAFFIWSGLLAGLNFILTAFISYGAGLKTRVLILPVAGVIFLFLLIGGLVSVRKKILWAKLLWALIFLFFLTLPWFFIEGQEKSAEPKTTLAHPKNVILIIADACRADGLGIYGGKNQTPNLDQLAQQGIWFKKAFSNASWTLPSIASLFSSQYPGVYRFGPGVFIISPNAYLLAERFRDYGYYTIGLISNWGVSYRGGYLQGFEKVYLHHHKVRLHRQFCFLPASLFWQRFILKNFGLKLFPDTSRILTERAIKFLKKAKQPFFLYLHYMDPHDPYDPPQKYLSGLENYKGHIHPPYGWGTADDIFHQEIINKVLKQKVEKDDQESQEYIRQLYLAEVRYLDFQVGQLVQTLKEQGLDKNTLLVFTSDHGEEFWEHGANQHGGTPYQELLKVPLIFWGAGLTPQQVDFPVYLIDLTPTLCELVGIPSFPKDQGRNLWKIIQENKKPKPILHFAEGGFGERIYSLQDQEFKLIYKPKREKYEFYNLKIDPLEKKDLYSPTLPEFISLKNALFRQLEEIQRIQQENVKKLQISPSQKEAIKQRLRSLGYIK